MECSYGVEHYKTETFLATKAVAAEEQPRPAVDLLLRRAIPHAEPCRQVQSLLLESSVLDCRLLIWEYVLRTPYTRLMRWQPHCPLPNVDKLGSVDANCFPYRLTMRSAPSELSELFQMFGTKKDPEQPLALLLSCRQIYSEALKVLYSSTSFIFDNPRDLHCFQSTVPPEGLASIKELVIPVHDINHVNLGPFYHDKGLQEWEEAFKRLGQMVSLRKLDILCMHWNSVFFRGEIFWTRPFEADLINDAAAEQRHQKLFELFATVHIPCFDVYLTWKPDDLLSQRKWPFKVYAQSCYQLLPEIRGYLNKRR